MMKNLGTWWSNYKTISKRLYALHLRQTPRTAGGSQSENALHDASKGRAPRSSKFKHEGSLERIDGTFQLCSFKLRYWGCGPGNHKVAIDNRSILPYTYTLTQKKTGCMRAKCAVWSCCKPQPNSPTWCDFCRAVKFPVAQRIPLRPAWSIAWERQEAAVRGTQGRLKVCKACQHLWPLKCLDFDWTPPTNPCQTYTEWTCI